MSQPNGPPLRPKASYSVNVIATLAVGYTLWAAQQIILPILLAIFFALIGNPILRLLQRARIPRFLAALMLLIAGILGTISLGAQLIGPASDWARQAPQRMQQMARQIQNLTRPVQQASEAAENLARATGGESARTIRIVRTQLDDPYRTLLRTPKLVASILAVVLLTFFFMIFGQELLRQAIARLPRRQQQCFASQLMRELEREISRYVLTISIINTLLGLVFSGFLYFLEIPLPETLLWGTVVALLNFAPYIGPLISALMMLVVGFVQFRPLGMAFLPAAIYLTLHILEGQVITPIVLGRRMALSPLILILGLMLFGWLWGLIGLLLAVPLLVCVKMILSRLDRLKGWAQLLE